MGNEIHQFIFQFDRTVPVSWSVVERESSVSNKEVVRFEEYVYCSTCCLSSCSSQTYAYNFWRNDQSAISETRLGCNNSSVVFFLGPILPYFIRILWHCHCLDQLPSNNQTTHSLFCLHGNRAHPHHNIIYLLVLVLRHHFNASFAVLLL